MPSISNILKQLPLRDLFSENVIGDSKRAAKIYSREYQTTYPALNHQFFASFSINNGYGYAVQPDLSFFVKSFDRPSVNFDLVEMHQYNKRRMVQTGVHYGPVTVSFYDVNDRTLQLLFVNYCRWYYGDFAELKDDKSWLNDITTSEFITDPAGWGFTPTDNPIPNMMYFFDHIDLYDVSTDGSYVLWRMMHPVIESWTLGNNDYEGSSQKLVTFVFKHEGFDVLAGHGVQGSYVLDQEFALSSLSEHAEVPGATRSFLTDAASITRDISAGALSNIAARFGLPLGGVIDSVQRGKINPTAIGSDAIRVVTGSSALNSFGNFIFGDVASSSSSRIGGVAGRGSSFLGLSDAGSASGISSAFGSLFGGFRSRGSGELSQNETESGDVLIISENSTNTAGIPESIVPTAQTLVSEEGRIELSLETSVSGTLPGKENLTGTELTKNYVNRVVSGGRQEISPGIDTNAYQAAQGLVQTGRHLPDDIRDSLAGAIVNASKRTGTPISNLAAKTKKSTSATLTRPVVERELALTAQALREVNRLKPASAQYGYKGQGLLNINDPDARRIIAAKR